jgi:hypothetical protein
MMPHTARPGWSKDAASLYEGDIYVTTFSVLSRSALSALAAVAILAGCGGSQSVSPMNPTQQSALAMRSPVADNTCPSKGGVRVSPCTVDFTSSNPGPDTVTVTTPLGKKGTLSELDMCGGASGIATVVQGSGNLWIVTAGAVAGSCKGRFLFRNMQGKVVGHAGLSITNGL